MDRMHKFLTIVGATLWRWNPIHKNCHRPDDKKFVSIWTMSLDPNHLVDSVRSCLPEFEEENIPFDEDNLRSFVRRSFIVPENEVSKPEELWLTVPETVRYLLIALNGKAIIADLERLRNAPYHTAAGKRVFGKAADSFIHSIDILRYGRKATLSKTKRCMITFYFIFCLYNTITTDVWAGLLGERAYNVRSVGSRVITLIQLWYMFSFEYTTFLLLFNWSLERVLGALVGNTVYGLAALIPAVGKRRLDNDFRTSTLIVSVIWQIGVQFSLPILALLDGLQMRWQAKSAQFSTLDHDIGEDLLRLRQRCDRFVMTCKHFRCGRTMDQMLSIVKSDISTCVRVYEFYNLTADFNPAEGNRKGYTEPRPPKLLLVIVDAILFAFVSFAFFTQPFTFNTVVAYGIVVTLKQAVLWYKRYETMVSARRLFTNMAGQNVWGLLLVAVPFRINQKVFDSSIAYASLMVAVAVAYWFLTEPIVYIVEFITGPIMPTTKCVVAHTEKVLDVEEGMSSAIIDVSREKFHEKKTQGAR